MFRCMYIIKCVTPRCTQYQTTSITLLYDPLLFGNRILDEYEIARTELDLCDEDIAQIASYSFVYSYASNDVKQRGLLAVRDWLATASTDKDDDDDATNNE